MRRKTDSARSGTVPEREWPEKVDRLWVILVVAVLLVGTPPLSIMLLSEHADDETIVIEPGSYHMMHFGFYGPGRLEYSATSLEGPQIYLLTLDRANFERFEEGRDYDYMSYQAIGISGGSGYSRMAGPMWEIFLVFVNDESTSKTVEFKADSAAYFSFPIALMLLGAVVTIGYAARRISDQKEPADAALSSHHGMLSERQKASATIAGLVVLSVSIVLIIGWALPADLPFGLTSVYYRLWFGTLASTAIAFSLRLRLLVVKENPGFALAQLAHRLRVSEYRVSEKPHQLSVQISSTSAIKIRTKPVPEGTLISYSADATPRGWSIVVVLLLISVVAPFSMAIALFMLYRSAVFASDRVLPRLSLLPIPEEPVAKADTRTVLIECLSEGRRLSAEAYEGARSNYQDSILIMVTASLVLSTVLALFCGAYLLQDLEAETRGVLSLLIGVVAGVTASLVSWRLLARRSKPRISELKAWTARLEVALSREVAQEQLPDGEPSSLELIVESYKETPKWLKARRKAGMFRDPGSWLLIFFFSYFALALGLGGAVDLWRGQLSNASVFLGMSAGLGSLAVFTYHRWRKHQSEQDEGMIEGLAKHIQTLKVEMETYLRSV